MNTQEAMQALHSGQKISNENWCEDDGPEPMSPSELAKFVETLTKPNGILQDIPYKEIKNEVK